MTGQAFYLKEVIEKIQDYTGKPVNQSVLAEDLDVSRQYISSLAKTELPLKFINKIENYYGMDLTKYHLVELDFYPEVFGSCGDGCSVFEESSAKLQVTKDVITNYSTNNKYSIISARGSSMSPVINEDDRLIIQHNIGSQIVDDTVYLFRYNDELFIKRLVKNVDQIVCISENPRFQDRIIEPKENNFTLIGKVVGLIRTRV
jgi:phage repressor protein C with HTH and peptisase S24 domain